MRKSSATVDSPSFALERFTFDLPDELIARYPSEKRGDSRLLVINRKTGVFSDHQFAELPHLLTKDDVLVRNTSAVVPCRVFLQTEAGRQLEAILIPYLRSSNADLVLGREQLGEQNVSTWAVLARGMKRGQVYQLGGFKLLASRRLDDRSMLSIASGGAEEILAQLDAVGKMPLPPYILSRRGDKRDWSEDRKRYQTVYADDPGSVAAPTAGLHFSEDILRELNNRCQAMLDLSLHVGTGTFQPIDHDDVRQHKMHEEWYSIPPSTIEAVESARAAGGRAVAIGTTTVRALESARRLGRNQGWTDLFLYPSNTLTTIDGMVTNFHLPSSSLLLLVMAFAGEELIRNAYEHAVDEGYRFYSYGDAMLIL